MMFRRESAQEAIMLAFFYLAFAVLFRLVPHGPFSTFCSSCGLWNFTPVGAALLYFGARQPRRRMWVPIAALAASDVVLNLLIWHVRLDASAVITCSWYAAAVLLGGALQKRLSIARLAACSVGVTAIFFLVSNFAVWAGTALYPHTLAGLYTSYVMAIPFVRSMLAGDLIFSAAFFGLPFVLTSLHRSVAQPTA
jgi:hypothetical protein